MNRRAGALVALLLVVLVGGLPALGTGADADQVEPRPDPGADVVGWEEGYWHNETVDVDQTDGLTEAELEAYVARAMARVEFLREREFNRTVPVSVISREEYRARGENLTENATYAAWNNQVWEALFIVGEDRDVQDELGTVSGEQTAGFYSVDADEIRIVTDSPDAPVIDNATLIHELVHALQDEHLNLSRPSLRAATQDGQLAVDALVEGEANYVQRRYTELCGAEWACVETPSQGTAGGGSDLNLGVFLTVIHPYSDGPVYIESLLLRGGWEAVDAAYDAPPVATEQVIHLTDETPTPIEFDHAAQGGWEPFPDQGTNGSDTVGEASIYAMFWYQAFEYGANTVPVQSVVETESPLDVYNYAVEASTGWGNDRVFPYHRETDTDTEYGYVWVTEWDTTADAGKFHATYLEIFSAHRAVRVADGTWVIREGPFTDAFRIDRSGTRVTIVNAPSVDDLDDILPDPTPTQGTPEETPPGPTPSVEPTDDTPQSPTGPGTDPTTAETTTPGQPGLGAAAALIALALAAALLVRRRRA